MNSIISPFLIAVVSGTLGIFIYYLFFLKSKIEDLQKDRQLEVVKVFTYIDTLEQGITDVMEENIDHALRIRHLEKRIK